MISKLVYGLVTPVLNQNEHGRLMASKQGVFDVLQSDIKFESICKGWEKP